MSTNTPRTDCEHALLEDDIRFGEITSEDAFEKMTDHARQLERELTAANERLETSESERVKYVEKHEYACQRERGLEKRLGRLRELAKLFLPSDSRDDMIKHRALRAELEKEHDSMPV